jgi:hypothetical protein
MNEMRYKGLTKRSSERRTDEKNYKWELESRKLRSELALVSGRSAWSREMTFHITCVSILQPKMGRLSAAAGVNGFVESGSKGRIGKAEINTIRAELRAS